MTDETKNGFSGEFENENEQDFSQVKIVLAKVPKAYKTKRYTKQ